MTRMWKIQCIFDQGYFFGFASWCAAFQLLIPCVCAVHVCWLCCLAQSDTQVCQRSCISIIWHHCWDQWVLSACRVSVLPSHLDSSPWAVPEPHPSSALLLCKCNGQTGLRLDEPCLVLYHPLGFPVRFFRAGLSCPHWSHLQCWICWFAWFGSAASKPCFTSARPMCSDQLGSHCVPAALSSSWRKSMGTFTCNSTREQILQRNIH